MIVWVSRRKAGNAARICVHGEAPAVTKSQLFWAPFQPTALSGQLVWAVDYFLITASIAAESPVDMAAM